MAPKIGEAGYERIEFDSYRTPGWVTEHLLAYIPFAGTIWEPAAGDGDMLDVVSAAGHNAVGTDIRGFRESAGINFIGMESHCFTMSLLGAGVRNIVTNPPYAYAQEFIERALMLTGRDDILGKVAMLLGFDYDTASIARWHLFRHPAFYAKLMLPRRISWVGLEKKASPRQIHAWFIWDWGKARDARPIIIYP